MNMLKVKEIKAALERTETMIVECSEKALPAYAYQLAGHAFALRFALGMTKRENHDEQTKVFKLSPFFRDKLKKANLL